MKKLILIVMLILTPVVAHSRDWYVIDSGGSGTACTDAEPCTPAYALANAAGTASAQDIVYFKAGTYYSAATGNRAVPYYHPNYSYVTLKPKTGDTVNIVSGSETNPAIGTGEGHPNVGIIVDGFNVEGSISAWFSTNMTIQNNNVWKGGGDTDFPNCIRIEYGTNTRIYNNYIHDNVSVGQNPQNSPLIMEYRSTGAIIENNRFHGNIGPAISLKDQPQNMTVRYNYFYDMEYAAVWSANQVVASGVYIYQNIMNNVGKSTESGSAIILWVCVDTVQIYNNTFYNCNGGVGWERANSLNCTPGANITTYLWNNIFYSNVPIYYNWLYSNTNWTNLRYSNYNDFYGDTSWYKSGTTYTTIADWRTACQANSGDATCDSNSVTANPNFLNGSRLWNTPSDWKRSSYPTNGRGGSYASVMGAYITGNETIGPTTSPNPGPNPPTGLRIVP